jgi:hypothetical protein
VAFFVGTRDKGQVKRQKGKGLKKKVKGNRKNN